MEVEELRVLESSGIYTKLALILQPERETCFQGSHFPVFASSLTHLNFSYFLICQTDGSTVSLVVMTRIFTL